jgi:protein gp37
MNDRSKIEWTDATWNLVRGCTKISPGCKHCYDATFAERRRASQAIRTNTASAFASSMRQSSTL